MARDRVIYRKRKMESVAIPEHSIKLLPVAQPGVFDLVGYVISAGEGKPYQSVFYNGTIEVVKQGKLWRGMDVLIFNGWHWWTHIDHIQTWDRLYKDMNRLVAYYKGMTTWLDGLMHLSIHLRPRFFSMAFLLFTDGRDWGEPMKSCKSHTQPFYGRKYSRGSPVAWVILNKVMRRLKKLVYLSAVKMLILVCLHWNHPGYDCSHWYLPGLPDSWNVLFYSALFS